MRNALVGFLLTAAFAAGASAETPNRWGAIALNLQTRGVGIGWNFSEDWEAKNEALQRCGWGACKVYVTGNNECSVLVVDFAKNVIGTGSASTKMEKPLEKATARAIYECKSRQGDCRINHNTAWVCAGDPHGSGDVVGFKAPEAPKPAPEPSITVQWSGEDAFLVKGVHFTPGAHVVLKVSGKATSLDTIAIDFRRRGITASADGTFSVRTGRVCNTGVQGDVTIAATDTKKSPTKPVTLRCRGGVNPSEIKIKPKP